MTNEELEEKIRFYEKSIMEERSRWTQLLIKGGHDKRALRLMAWLAGGSGLVLGALLGRWSAKRDQRN